MPLARSSIPREYWALALIMLSAVFVVSPGFFSIDEAIYYLGARAVAERSALGIDNNGFAQFHSESLKLRFLIEGPQGLTPQYPAGSALLAAPLIPFLGPKTFILLNALASIGTVFTVRKICIYQFGRENVARIAIVLLIAGTFWLEYAVGVWPHMLSAFFVLQAYWFALRHLNSNGENDRDAIISGLFAGAGMLVRLDAILAVAVVGLIIVLFAARPVRSSFLFGVAVLPSLVLASGLNYLKFGSANPLSYGRFGGNIDISSYVGVLSALCVALAALLLCRKFAGKISGRLAIGALIVILGALLIIPATNSWLLRFWNGFLALVVDAREIEDNRAAVQRGPGNTMVLWGQVKKALGQSMPWLGITAILLTRGVPRQERRFTASLLIFTAVLTLPFILLAWHGGGGSNMRYFLPVLPALCILAAKPLSDLWTLVPKATVFAALGAWVSLGLCLAWTLLLPSGFIGVQQILSTYVLLATGLTAMAAGVGWPLQQAARRMVIVLVTAGFMMSASFAISDFTKAAQRRASNYTGRLALVRLPSKSLIIAYPEWVGDLMPGNGSIIAVRDETTRQIDPRLVPNAFDAGYRVFMVSYEFDAVRDVPTGFEAVETDFETPNGNLIELRRAQSSHT